jgi:hypothetical protein
MRFKCANSCCSAWGQNADRLRIPVMMNGQSVRS